MLRKTASFFLLLMVLLPASVWAQRAVEIRLGASAWYAKDQTISESIFSGSTPSLWVGFESASPHKRFRVHTALSRGTINSSYNHEWQLTSISLTFARDFAFSHRTAIHHFLPIEVVVNTLLAESTYFANRQAYSGRTSGFADIQLVSGYDGQIILPHSYMLDAGVRFSLIGYGYRSGYSVVTPDNLLGQQITAKNVLEAGEIIHLFSAPSASGHLLLSKTLSSHVMLTLGYRYSFERRGDNKPYKSITQKLTGGVQWTW